VTTTRRFELIRTNADTYNNRGLAYGQQGNFNKEISDYNEAIRLDPSHAAAYNNRGVAYLHIGSHAKAKADFATAKRLKAGQ
jgi:tetratricopeptide (TPR) repeat protein